MKNEIDNVLDFDPIAQTEKIVGKKHWSEFTEDENRMALVMAMFSGQHKDEILQAANDTYFSMTWNAFLRLIEERGFKCGLKYNILHDGNKIDEAVIYFCEDGLIIWADSYSNKKSLNSGTLYGEFLYDEWNDDKVWNALSHCSHGSIKDIENSREFSKDVREGMFNTINKVSAIGKLNPIWMDNNRFLWFVDYAETKIEGYDHQSINQSKIEKLPEEARKIIGR
jgi:hypothetical protein